MAIQFANRTRIRRHSRPKTRLLLLTAQLHLYKLMPERFWIPYQTFAADGGTRPKFRGRSVSSALSCISFRIGQKAPQERFSEESSRTTTQSENVFL